MGYRVPGGQGVGLQSTQGSRGRVAEVAREHGCHPPKSLDSDENFKPEHTLFCRELRFVAIYALFGDLWAKKCLLGSKTENGKFNSKVDSKFLIWLDSIQ